MKAAYIFFGHIGSGKTWTGSRFAKKMGFYFYDGDDSLPPNLKEKVARCSPLTREEVRKFVREELWWDILIQANQHGKVVVSQALYNDSDRIWLQRRLRAWNVDTLWVEVKVPLWQNLRQLWGRKSGLKWVLMHLLSRDYFERPTHYCLDIMPVV